MKNDDNLAIPLQLFFRHSALQRDKAIQFSCNFISKFVLLGNTSEEVNESSSGSNDFIFKCPCLSFHQLLLA